MDKNKANMQNIWKKSPKIDCSCYGAYYITVPLI